MLLCRESAVGAFIAKRFWLFRNKHWAVGLLPLHLCFLAEGGSLLKKEKGRHLPIFPGRLQPSIFGTIELNFCVRDGNRWNLGVIGTGYECA